MANNKNGSKWIRRDKRLAIYLRDGMACAYCGATLEDGTQLTLDHIVPRSKGGGNAASNLITACGRCNTSRADRDVSEFADAVATYINHGVTSQMILAHIQDCIARPLTAYRQEAREIISRRATWSGALQEAADAS